MPTEFSAGNRYTGLTFDTGTGEWTLLPPEATTAWTTNDWVEMIDNGATLTVPYEDVPVVRGTTSVIENAEKIEALEKRIEYLEKLIASNLWKQITEEYEEGQEQT